MKKRNMIGAVAAAGLTFALVLATTSVPAYARSDCYRHYGKDRDLCFRAERASEKAREAWGNTKQRTRDAWQTTRDRSRAVGTGLRQGWRNRR